MLGIYSFYSAQNKEAILFQSDLRFGEKLFTNSGGELQIEQFGFRLTVPPGALGSSQRIGLKVLTDVPDNLELQDDEIIPCFGFQGTPAGLQFKYPVTINIPHCAILTDPLNVKVVMHTRDSAKGMHVLS